MRKLFCVLFLLITLTSQADDSSELLKAEYDYISELLTMNMPAVAQQHLDIVKTEFPREKREIYYYQAHISFRQASYPKAIVNLERLIKEAPTPSRFAEARKLLTLAYLRIGQFESAIKYLKTLKPSGGKESWYADTCVELAEAQAAAYARKPAEQRCELKKDSYVLFKDYLVAYPEQDKAPLIQYFVAEYEYDVLVALLYKLGKLKDEASPDVVKEKKRAIIIQLHKARKLYQLIKDTAPKHKVIKRVEPRLLYLLNVVDKLKRNESFLPKDETP